MAFCQHCGAELANAPKFCSACGKPTKPQNATVKNELKEIGAPAKRKVSFFSLSIKFLAILGGLSIIILLVILITAFVNRANNTQSSKAQTSQSASNKTNKLEKNGKKAFQAYLLDKFSNKNDGREASDDAVFYFSDINSDGVKDMIVFYTATIGGSVNGWVQFAAVFYNDSQDSFKFFSDAQTGSRQVSLIDTKLGINFSGPIMTCTESYWTDVDAGCCPSGRRQKTLTITVHGIL
jgi:hypothetical protein